MLGAVGRVGHPVLRQPVRLRRSWRWSTSRLRPTAAPRGWSPAYSPSTGSLVAWRGRRTAAPARRTRCAGRTRCWCPGSPTRCTSPSASSGPPSALRAGTAQYGVRTPGTRGSEPLNRRRRLRPSGHLSALAEGLRVGLAPLGRGATAQSLRSRAFSRRMVSSRTARTAPTSASASPTVRRAALRKLGGASPRRERRARPRAPHGAGPCLGGPQHGRLGPDLTRRRNGQDVAHPAALQSLPQALVVPINRVASAPPDLSRPRRIRRGRR